MLTFDSMNRFVYLFAATFLCLQLTSQTLNYYFGNLHSHTGFSDGNKDSSQSGVSRPDGSYAYAKLSKDFDFLGISEHNHYSGGNPGFRKQNYQVGLNMANSANQDGSFLALFGLEYGVSNSYNGHLIIYGFNQLIGWETSANGVSGPNYDIYNAKSDYDGIFTKVARTPGTFCYLAHPWYSDFSTNGTSSGGLANSAYNAKFDSAIVGTPLRSGIAFSQKDDYSDYSSGGSDYFNIYRKLLAIGYHLGIGYDHDNHYTNFGRSNGGRLVIIAPSLSRANLFTAMQQMNFYGSDDSNAKVEFTMNGNIMGSILTGTAYPTFNVVHNDPDGEQADSLKIWRGEENTANGVWSQPVYAGKGSNTATFTDWGITSGIEYHYFVEIKQADGQWIVTSPIWFKGSAPVLVKEELPKVSFNCFPNPVSKNLSISAGEANAYTLRLKDLAGREVLQRQFDAANYNLTLTDVAPGVYLLEVESNKGRYAQKLVVE